MGRVLHGGPLGADRHQDYVIAAVTIFLDVLNLFLFILALVGGGDRRG